jgi:hypothetical protein
MRRAASAERKGKKSRFDLPPPLIVHLPKPEGQVWCGLPKPWPTTQHRLAAPGEVPPRKDVCLTCDYFSAAARRS